MKKAIRVMKLIALFSMAAHLLGCSKIPSGLQILDGPGMVYVDREYRTEYANTLPFDDIEGYPFWAVAYLGCGEAGREKCEAYKKKLFSELSEESLAKIQHFDFEGDQWYLVIPRYGLENEIIPLGQPSESRWVRSGEAFTVTCNSNIKIAVYDYEGHEFSLQTDGEGHLISGEDVWDITEYESS